MASQIRQTVLLMEVEARASCEGTLSKVNLHGGGDKSADILTQNYQGENCYVPLVTQTACSGGGGGYYGGKTSYGGSGMVYTYHTKHNIKSRLILPYLIKPFTAMIGNYQLETNTREGFQFDTLEVGVPSKSDKDGLANITQVESYNIKTDNILVYNCNDTECGVLAPAADYNGGILSPSVDSGRQIKIPSSVDNKPITRIEEYAFFGNEIIASITLPSTITEIKEGAFFCARNLQRIVFEGGSNPLVIGPISFVNTSLESIDFPSNIAQIEYRAFFNITTLTSIRFNERLNQVLTIQSYAFSRTCIINVQFPHNLISLGDFSFSESSIEYITLPITLKSIGNYAFQQTNLNSVKFPTSLKSIGNYAFYNIPTLSIVKFSDNAELDYVGECCFGMSGIREFTMPPKLTYIASRMFWNTFNLDSISYHPDSKITIFKIGCFSGSAIQRIEIPSTVLTIEYDAFSYYNQNTGTYLTEIIFNQDSQLQIIEDNAFYATNIKTVTIPKNVNYIGKSAFQNCNQLSKVLFEQGSVIRMIGENCFDSCKILTLEIPKTLLSISSNLFKNCEKLSEISFEAGSQCSIIGSSAFAGTAIRSISLPGSIFKIENQAFKKCVVLNVFITCSPYISFGDNVFEGASKLAFVNVSVDYKLETAGVLPVYKSIEKCVVKPQIPRCTCNLNVYRIMNKLRR